MRVGIIADTHLPGLYRTLDQIGPEIGEFLSTVALILHAGDVTVRNVIEWCERFAPVYVARGNHDHFDHPHIEEIQFMELEGWRIGMTHELRPESRPIQELIAGHFGGAELDILIAGDTHMERLEFRDGVILLNPGSVTLPHHKEVRLGTVAVLELSPGRVHAEIVVLGQTPGMPNPGTAQHIEVVEGRLVAASWNGEPLPLPDQDE